MGDEGGARKEQRARMLVLGRWSRCGWKVIVSKVTK